MKQDQTGSFWVVLFKKAPVTFMYNSTVFSTAYKNGFNFNSSFISAVLIKKHLKEDFNEHF